MMKIKIKNLRENNQLDELNMDFQTYKKVSPTLNPTEKKDITITSDKPKTSNGSTVSTMNSMAMTEDVEKPIGKIKYVSNIKDENGGISKPFSIGGKKYQMVRGINDNKEIIPSVYCYDELNEDGENRIHSVDYFDKNIAKQLITQDEMTESSYDFADAERSHADKEDLISYLNLKDLNGYKHFFVNIKTGDVTAKFRNTKEMAMSGSKLGPDEDYMDIKALRRFRLGDYFKKDISEDVLAPEDANTNIPKLQSDVKKLANSIKNKFSVYLAKIDKPIEQAQFLTAMANEIGVPLNKLSSIIQNYKDVTKDGLNENKVITKNQLIEEIISNSNLK